MRTGDAGLQSAELFFLRPSNQRFCDINPPSFPVITTAHSLPCLLCLWLNGIHRPPPAARPLIKASSRPLPEGAGSAWRLAPDTVHGGKQDLRGVSRLKPGEGMLSRGSASMGYRPLGVGLAGAGGGTSPSPVPACHRERFSWSTPAPVSSCHRKPLSPDHPRLPSPFSPQCRLAKNRMVHL